MHGPINIRLNQFYLHFDIIKSYILITKFNSVVIIIYTKCFIITSLQEVFCITSGPANVFAIWPQFWTISYGEADKTEFLYKVTVYILLTVKV